MYYYAYDVHNDFMILMLLFQWVWMLVWNLRCLRPAYSFKTCLGYIF